MIVIIWIICGLFNMLCVYLTDVTFKRPDFVDEYRFLSWKTLFTFISGPIISWIIWVGPVLAHTDLDVYNSQK